MATVKETAEIKFITVKGKRRAYYFSPRQLRAFPMKLAEAELVEMFQPERIVCCFAPFGTPC